MEKLESAASRVAFISFTIKLREKLAGLPMGEVVERKGGEGGVDFRGCLCW